LIFLTLFGLKGPAFSGKGFPDAGLSSRNFAPKKKNYILIVNHNQSNLQRIIP